MSRNNEQTPLLRERRNEEGENQIVSFGVACELEVSYTNAE